MVINRDSKGKRSSFRVSADRAGLQLTVDQHFWNDEIVDYQGTTQLDINIATVIQEVRAALYFIATDSTRH